MKCSNIFILPLLIILTFMVSCQKADESKRTADKLTVTATIFPVYDLARAVGGDKIDISMLLPPGTDVHHYELKPQDIIKVSGTDVFLFTSFEMENWVYKITRAAAQKSQMIAVETGRGAFLLPLTDEDPALDHGHDDANQHAGYDPHIWLDMDNARKMVDNIAEAFVQNDSRNSEYYLKNADALKLKLSALDQRYRSELSSCRTKTVLHAGHWAFAYPARKYNLKYVAAYNVLADAEPSPQTILYLIDQIKKEKVHYIFYEDMLNPRLAETIARETGVGLLKLNNGHDISARAIKEGETFISVMEKNLANLKKGLECR